MPLFPGEERRSPKKDKRGTDGSASAGSPASTANSASPDNSVSASSPAGDNIAANEPSVIDAAITADTRATGETGEASSACSSNSTGANSAAISSRSAIASPSAGATHSVNSSSAADSRKPRLLKLSRLAGLPGLSKLSGLSKLRGLPGLPGLADLPGLSSFGGLFKKKKASGPAASADKNGTVPARRSGEQQSASLIKSKEQRTQERKQRRRELIIAGGGLLLVLVMMFFQLQYFSSGSIFFAFFFLNAILLLGIIYVVLRNGMKLLLERRRRVIGSRLRTRLVLAISAMTLVPCLIMFLVTAQFVKISVDFWFKDQVESTVETALEVARATYDNAGQRLRSQAEFSLREIEERRYGWGGMSMDSFLELKRREYSLPLMGVLDEEFMERNWHAERSVGDSWQMAKANIDWQVLNRDGFMFFPGKGTVEDLMFGILAVNGGDSGYLVLAENMGEDFLSNLERVSSGSDEYKTLRSLKRPLKGMLYVTLTVLTALIALATIWFAFRVGKELTSPITALVAATERMAQGDTDVRIEDTSSDEFTVLVAAFNRMAGEIGQSRQELTDTNALLAQQNLVLDQQRRYVETVLDNIAAGVMSFGANWRVTTANKAACEFLGLPLEQIIGRAVMDFLPPLQAREAKRVGMRLLRKPGSHFQHQLTFTRDSEDRHLLATSVGLPSPAGKFHGGVVVFEDVTEMEKMQRMAAWREVARRIAHEIKNPLTPIKLSAQRLEKKFGQDVPDPVFKQSTQLIVRQVEQLQSMVQEFSSFAKLPEIRLRRAKLGPLLEDSVNMFRNSHSGIEWKLALPGNLPEVEIDGAAMQRVFLNILTNATEALSLPVVPGGGGSAGGADSQPVASAGHRQGAVSVQASLDPEMKLIRIDFADNGPGLTSEERKRLFEPYFSRKKGGTGLGLTIVRSIVTEHRGYVRASEHEGGGTVITIELPIV